MKYILILFMLVSTGCYGQEILMRKGQTIKFTPINDSLIGWKSLHENGIKQDAFFSFGIWHLVTSDGSLFDNVIHGSLEFIKANEIIEYNKALAKRKPIVVLTVICK